MVPEMNHRDVEDLLRLPERFVDGERTKPVADEIEGLIVNCFQDEPWFDDTSYALALFVPGGTTPYIDQSGLARELAHLAAGLKADLRDTPEGGERSAGQ